MDNTVAIFGGLGIGVGLLVVLVGVSSRFKPKNWLLEYDAELAICMDDIMRAKEAVLDAVLAGNLQLSDLHTLIKHLNRFQRYKSMDYFSARQRPVRFLANMKKDMARVEVPQDILPEWQKAVHLMEDGDESQG